jgi:DNA-binding MarR family transcriptional regulator
LQQEWPIEEEQSPRVVLSTQELAAVARLLQKLLPLSPGTPTIEAASAIEIALRMHQARRDRRHFLPVELFADPAWDMLLFLYCMEGRALPVSISSLCGASETPSTTALRWIKELEGRGLIERVPHPTDGRSMLAQLTRDTHKKMTDYFNRVSRDQLSLLDG